jgi:hypothetical protein
MDAMVPQPRREKGKELVYKRITNSTNVTELKHMELFV